jgi:hypothetical protein
MMELHWGQATISFHGCSADRPPPPKQTTTTTKTEK